MTAVTYQVEGPSIANAIVGTLRNRKREYFVVFFVLLWSLIFDVNVTYIVLGASLLQIFYSAFLAWALVRGRWHLQINAENVLIGFHNGRTCETIEYKDLKDAIPAPHCLELVDQNKNKLKVLNGCSKVSILDAAYRIRSSILKNVVTEPTTSDSEK